MRGGSSKRQAHVSQTQLDSEGNPHERTELHREGVRKLRNFLGTLENLGATGTCSLALSGKTLSFALNVLDKIHLVPESLIQGLPTT